MKNGNKVRNICIDGPGGSGKTTLARSLMEYGGFDPLKQLIHGDWYFERWEQPAGKKQVPGFFNSQRFMQDVGNAINGVGEYTVREYLFLPDNKSKLVDRPAPNLEQLIIVEGIKMIGLPVDWDIRVWMDTPREVREQRFMARTRADRRSDALEDIDVRLKAFNHWADDADRYAQEIGAYEREDVLVVSGLAAVADQISAIQDFARKRG